MRILYITLEQYNQLLFMKKQIRASADRIEATLERQDYNNNINTVLIIMITTITITMLSSS